MAIDAEPLHGRRPPKPRDRAGGLVLRLEEDRDGPALPRCIIDDQPVPGGWGDWHYRMPPGPHRVAVGMTPPLIIDIAVSPGGVSTLDVKPTGSRVAPYAIWLAQHPPRPLLVRLLSFLYILSVCMAGVVPVGALLLISWALS